MKKLISKIREAASDPDAPWYGSDLVPLMADACAVMESQQKMIDCWSYCTWVGMRKTCPEKDIVLQDIFADMGLSPWISSAQQIENLTENRKEGES